MFINVDFLFNLLYFASHSSYYFNLQRSHVRHWLFGPWPSKTFARWQ